MKPQKLISLTALAVAILTGCGKDETAESSSPSTGAPEERKQQGSDLEEMPSPDAQPAEEEPFRERKKRIWMDILQLIEDSEIGLTMKEWKIVKAQHWRPEYDEVVWKEADTETVLESLATPKEKDPLIAQVVGGDFTGVEDRTEQESLISLHFLALCAVLSRGGVSVPEVLEERSGDPDITRGDVILFEFFNDAYYDRTTREGSQAELEHWKRLATAPNSLHRLLALKNFIVVEPEPKHRLEFYRNYLEEPDPGILKEVLVQVFRTDLPEAADLLSEIQVREDVAANPGFFTELGNHIEHLKNLPPLEE